VGIDLYAPSLPEIASSLRLDSSVVQWSISIFTFGLCLGMFFLGALTDWLGRKPILLGGSIAFIISSLCITLIHSPTVLLSIRLFQGIAAGGMQAAIRGVIVDVFQDDHERSRVVLYITTAWGLGPILAPWVGSLLQHAWGWAGCFYGFVVYGLLLFSLYILIYKETCACKIAFHFRKIMLSSFNMFNDIEFTCMT